MATILIFKSLQVFQSLNRLPYYLEWQTHNCRLTHCLGKDKSLNQYKSSLLILYVLFTIYLLTITSTLKYGPAAMGYSWNGFLFSIFLAMNIGFTVILDKLVFVFQKDMAQILNWLLQETLLHKLIAVIIFQLSVTVAILIGLVLPAFILHKNQDPLFMLVTLISGRLPAKNWLFNSLRYLFLYTSFQCISVNISFICVICSTIMLCVILLIYQSTAKCLLFRYGFQRYRSFLVLLKHAEHFSKTTFLVGFSVSYCMISLMVSSLLLTLKTKQATKMSVCVNLTALQIYVFMQFLCFATGCYVKSWSTRIIQQWRLQHCLRSGYMSKKLIRYVNSFTSLMFQVGDIGVIDKRMQIHFLNSIFSNIINVLVIFTDLVH